MYNEQDIEKLFSKKFEKFEIKSSEEEWSRLSSKLSRSNFLKFSFVTFNVYYLLALLTFAGTATFTGYKNLRLTKEVKQLEQTIETYQKEKPTQVLSVPLDSDRINPQIIKANKSGDAKTAVGNNPGLQGKNVNIEGVKPSNVVLAVKDTSRKIDSKPVQVDTTNSKKIKRVKKTIAIKKDKVVVKDTVVITKPSK